MSTAGDHLRWGWGLESPSWDRGRRTWPYSWWGIVAWDTLTWGWSGVLTRETHRGHRAVCQRTGSSSPPPDTVTSISEAMKQCMVASK